MIDGHPESGEQSFRSFVQQNVPELHQLASWPLQIAGIKSEAGGGEDVIEDTKAFAQKFEAGVEVRMYFAHEDIKRHHVPLESCKPVLDDNPAIVSFDFAGVIPPSVVRSVRMNLL